MSRSRVYPLANRTAQWFEDAFDRATMPVIEKVLLHTTETTTWPGYDGGAKAPTLTYHPWLTTGRWRQHNWLNTSARALRDPSDTPVRENRDGVVQIEIVAYCNPASYKVYGHGVTALPGHAYEDLGRFLGYMHTEWGVPLVRAPQWLPYPPPDSIRMSSATYDAFRGVLGHQHASGNTHGDPGMTNLQVDRILTAAKRFIGTPAPVLGGTMSLTDADKLWIRAQMDDAISDYFIRFWTAESGTGTALRAAVAEVRDTVRRIEAEVKTP